MTAGALTAGEIAPDPCVLLEGERVRISDVRGAHTLLLVFLRHLR